VRVVKDRYQDSVRLMRINEALRVMPGVKSVGVVMGTPANFEMLEAGNLLSPEALLGSPNDIVLAVLATSAALAEDAVETGLRMLDETQQASRPVYASTQSAIANAPEATVGFVAVPGEHAAREMEAILAAGRSVVVFSDNVPIEEEVRLKRLAHESGLLVMGPDAGTALLGAIGIGFCNHVPAGRVGIVAASGTGAQAVSAHLAARGEGISSLLGLGGRDTSDAVGGVSLFDALTALDHDPATEVIVLVAKTMGKTTGRRLLARIPSLTTPMVVLVPGWSDAWVTAALGAFPSFSFQDASRRVVEVLRDGRQQSRGDSSLAAIRIPSGAIRGLFAGGTLAQETRLALTALLVDSSQPGVEVLDLGDDEYTVGRPHPMIAPSLQADKIVEAGGRADTGIVIFDVVLGFGAHADPASIFAPAVQAAKATAAGNGRDLLCIAVVCGTDSDPQGLTETVHALRGAGAVVVRDTAEAAALATGYLAHVPSQDAEAPTFALPSPQAIVTVGTDWFDEGLERQGAEVLHVEWRPTAGGDDELAAILGRLG
jgi:FdrA protein